jgi:hypothetical protein
MSARPSAEPVSVAAAAAAGSAVAAERLDLMRALDHLYAEVGRLRESNAALEKRARVAGLGNMEHHARAEVRPGDVEQAAAADDADMLAESELTAKLLTQRLAATPAVSS